MKRRVTVEIDDTLFPVYNKEADRYGSVQRLLAGAMGGILDFDLKVDCHRQLKRYGVIIIKDEQI